VKRGPLIAALASVGVIILIVAVLILPKAGQVRSKQREVAEAKQQQSTLQLQVQQLQAAAKDAPKDRKTLAKLQAAIPPTTDLPGLIRLLNSAAGESGVDFMSVSPSQPVASPSGNLSVIGAQITVLGGFFAVDQYLFRLESLPRAAKVTSIQVGPGPDQWPQLQVALTVEFYTTDTNAGPGSVPGATTQPGAPGTSAISPIPGASPSPSAGSPSPSVSP
jgi:Tfp pilus assembly protein PilO